MCTFQDTHGSSENLAKNENLEDLLRVGVRTHQPLCVQRYVVHISGQGCQFLARFTFMYTFKCRPEAHSQLSMLHVFADEWRCSLRMQI